MTNYPTIAQLLFDYDELMDPSGNNNSKPMQVLSYKSFPNMELQTTFDGNRYLWSEWKYEEDDFYVFQDEAAPTNTFYIANKAGAAVDIVATKKLAIDDTVLFYANDPAEDYAPGGDVDCCSSWIQRTITNVETETSPGPTLGYAKITVEGAPFIAKGVQADADYNGTGVPYPGDLVQRLFHSRNDCEIITNTVHTSPYDMKQSYIQHLGYTIDIDKSSLNKAYDTENGVMEYLRQRFRGANMKMINESARAFYFGRNRTSANVPGNPPGETLGLINGIINAQAVKPELRLIRSAANLLTDDDKVRLILEMIMAVQNSGMVPRGSVTTMICDEKAMASMMKMNSAWNKFTGFTVNRNDNIQKDFTLPVIQTPNGKTELMQCSTWTRLTRNSGQILFISKDLVGLRARKNATFDLNTGGINISTQGFNIADVTDLRQHECREYDIRTEMSIIIGGLDTGAHMILEGLC